MSNPILVHLVGLFLLLILTLNIEGKLGTCLLVLCISFLRKF